MKLIAYAFMAVVLVTLLTILLIAARGLIKMACLIGLIFLAAIMFHEINK